MAKGAHNPSRILVVLLCSLHTCSRETLRNHLVSGSSVCHTLEIVSRRRHTWSLNTLIDQKVDVNLVCYLLWDEQLHTNVHGQRKRRRSDPVLWQNPLYQQKIRKPKDNAQTPPKTSITQRLRTDLGRSVGVTSHPTGVVKPINGYPTFPLTAKAVQSKGHREDPNRLDIIVQHSVTPPCKQGLRGL